jgi:3'(2'),5'-bisphosphate nucleotidase
LITLALQAGVVIMEVHDAGVEAIDKLDGSPVTIADHRAEALIEAGLAILAPYVPVIAEEAVAEGRIPTLQDAFFLVDPIDGTRDFVVGKTGEFTVNIALIEHGVPVMGVVLAPATGELFAGEISSHDLGHALKISVDGRTGVELAPRQSIKTQTMPPASGPRVIASRHAGYDAATKRFLAKLGAHERISASSSIKFCRLAEAGADLYPRFGPVNEWDIAAGHAVLRAAGGALMRLDGVDAYGARGADFGVKGFIAYAGDAAKKMAEKALS